MRDLVAEYLQGAADVAEFYARPPRALLTAPPEPAAWDERLVVALRAYQEELGATASFAGNEAVVITGQQPAIFAGPLYTIYKAITAIRLAESVREKFDVPCTPVFWVGSEDHDFDEARSASFLTKDHQPLTVTYAPERDVDGLSMHRVPLDDSVHAFVDQAAREVPGSEFRDEIAAFLHESLDAASSLADWTARALARLFRNTALVFFAPHLPEARALGVTILEREIEEPLATTALLNDAANRLERLDFQPQLVKGDSECNFFLEVDGHRRKVTFERGAFVLPEEDTTFAKDELLALLRESPERFSPNVALRCIVQQYLFPVAAYVAGPGEIAYWAQLRPLFDHFGLPMPVVYPRASCALTTIKLNKIAGKLGLGVGDLTAGPEALLERAMRNSSSNPAVTLAETHRDTIRHSLEELALGLGKHDSTAASMAQGLVKEIDSKFDRLERTLLRSDGAKTDSTRKQLERLCNSLAPGKKPQERVYSVFSYLFEHGWDLVPRLLDEIDVESFAMNEVEL